MSRSTSANASDAARLTASDALGTHSNSSASDGGSGAADEWTIAPKLDTSTDGDACTWYAEGICARPRSCFDCLNVVIRGQKVRPVRVSSLW